MSPEEANRPLVLPRDRDAWATLRGYVYQVDCTLLRWLDLEPEEFLELERGEDIDLVHRAVTASGEAESERIFEQVKQREKTLTLHSEEAIEAIVNFFEHQQANPTLRLRFLFTTTAAAGREKKPPRVGFGRGLDVWESIRKEQLSPEKEREALGYVISLLRRVPKPKAIHQPIFDSFLAWLGGEPQQVLEFIKKFEWGMNSPDPRDLPAQVKAKLLHHRLAQGDAEATEAYLRLFSRVFRVLSERGTKRLERSMLVAVLTEPLARNQEAILGEMARLRSEVEVWKDKLGELERHQIYSSSRMAQMGEQIGVLATTVGVDLGLTLERFPEASPPPPLVEHLSLRQEATDRLLAAYQQSGWNHLTGDAGAGKTHVARLLVEADDECALWLRFRGLTAMQGRSLLLSSLSRLTGKAPSMNRARWYAEVLGLLPPGKWLVLDDLPRLLGTDELSDELVFLCSSLGSSQRKVLSVSYYALPVRLLERLKDNTFSTSLCPLLTDHEASEIFEAFGGKNLNAFTNLVSSLNRLARGNPMVVTAMAKYLKDRDWRIDLEAIEGVFHHEHTHYFSEQIREQIRELVQDDFSRELLYRLKTNEGAFRQEEVHLLASVPVAVPRASDRLLELTGLWIGREGPSAFRLSPLVEALPEDLISPEVLRSCHRQLARYKGKGQLTPSEAIKVIKHHCKGDEAKKACTLLIMAISHLVSLPTQVDHGGMLDVWRTSPLPEGVGPGTRLFVRIVQLDACTRYELRITYLLKEIENLLEEDLGEDYWEIASAGTMGFRPLMQLRPSLASRLFAVAVQAAPKAMLPNTPFPKHLMVQVLWITIPQTPTPEAVSAWLDAVACLSAEEREGEGSARMQGACIGLTDQVWLQEARKEDSQRDWPGALQCLALIEERAKDLNFTALWASVQRVKTIILGEFLNRLEDGLRLANDSLLALASSPYRYIVEQGLGQELVFAKRGSQALPVLRAAHSATGAKDQVLMDHVSVFGAMAAEQANPSEMLTFLEPRVQEIPEEQHRAYERAMLLGELGLARWKTGASAASSKAFSEAARLLLQQDLQERRWQDFALDLLKAISLCDPQSRETILRSHPPGTELTIPPQGFFHGFITGERIAFSDHTVPALCVVLFRLADTIEDDEQIAFWIEKYIHSARPDLSTSPFLIPALPYLSLIDKPAVGLLSIQVFNSVYTPLSSAPPHELAKMDDYRWTCMVLYPALAAVAKLIVTARPVGLLAAKNMAKELQKHPNASNPDGLWAAVADAFQYLARGSSRRLIQDFVSKESVCKTENAFSIFYLMASLCDDATLEEAALWQVCCVLAFHDVFLFHKALYRSLLSPLLVGFWEQALVRSRFHFAVPSETEQQLADAKLAPVEQQGPRALLAVLQSLRITHKLPESIRRRFVAIASGG